VHAAFPANPFGVNQPYVRLVNQRDGLQRVLETLVAHVPLGKPVQLGVHQGHQPVKCRLVAFDPSQQQLNDLG
jgi:hypothetical protein